MTWLNSQPSDVFVFLALAVTGWLGYCIPCALEVLYRRWFEPKRRS